ncbi:hypothetical protein SLEP1_g16409 [Rubroshorea leprosula]|uniref:Uncharacterized protein n=1 Tax=Rubroshorea leprosula TaxID=152421 RepID=A0AAV5IQQ3_9ROSI|nr:hypothetical protein SLEP1_g16409 [Rubroshorea leprosula]
MFLSVSIFYFSLPGKSEDIDRVKEAQVACPYSKGQESEEIMSNSKIDSSGCPGSHPNDCQVLSVSEYTNTSLPDGAQALEHGNAQSGEPCLASICLFCDIINCKSVQFRECMNITTKQVLDFTLVLTHRSLLQNRYMLKIVFLKVCQTILVENRTPFN